MKKALSNPAVAVFLALVLIIASTLISVNIKLGAKSDKVIDGFYDGVKYNGYVQPSVSSQLKNIMDYAAGLVTIANNYDVSGELIDEAQNQINALRGTMSTSRDNAYFIYERYQALIQSVDSLSYALGTQSLSERDQSGVEQYLINITGAMSTIDGSGYNESVRDFYRSYDRFPANVLGRLAGVDYPTYFE